MPEDAWQLMYYLLRVKPEERLTAELALNVPYFRDLFLYNNTPFHPTSFDEPFPDTVTIRLEELREFFGDSMSCGSAYIVPVVHENNLLYSLLH